MTRKSGLVVLLAFFVLAASCPASPIQLHTTRQHADDLEAGGDLAGVAKGQTRFITLAELLRLPQETHTVSDDSNFAGTVTLSGIPLEVLGKALGAAPQATMAIAICDDLYNAHYPPEYIAAHHPLLVLRINGKLPAAWPKGSDGSTMGPYMVSHASFTPSFHVLAHTDEPQIPWGVLRIDFRNPAEVYAPITPKPVDHDAALVHQGFLIARQNCFRCHSRGGEGGTKSPMHWDDIARDAATDADFFDSYVRTPKKMDPDSQMAPSPQYDAATLSALRAYFQTFTESAH